MCGYCTEMTGLSLLAVGAEGLASRETLHPLQAWEYLQVCPDIVAALRQVGRLDTGNAACARILACRGIELLTREGFASTRYQALLKDEAFRAALAVATGEAAWNQCTAVGSRFPSAGLEWLFAPEVFLEDGYFTGRFGAWPVSEAEALLEHYVAFRLDGHDLRRNDLGRRFEQTGVFDPLEDVAEQDQAATEAAFPFIWLALLKLASAQDLSTTVWKLVATNPVGVPPFVSPELWLQRQAALTWHDRWGWAGFLGERIKIRPELFLYLALLRPPSQEDRTALLKSWNEITDADYCGEHFGLRAWLESGMLQFE